MASDDATLSSLNAAPKTACKTSILRNGQQISSINLPDFKFSQQDGGSGTEAKTFGIVITSDLISYYTLSNQDNISNAIYDLDQSY